MGRFFTSLVGSILLVAPVAASSGNPVATEAKLRVVIFDYAKVDATVLSEARCFAKGVFQDAGVELEWAAPLDKTGGSRGARGQELRLAIRIVPDSMIGSWAGSDYLLGYSLVPSEGGMGSIAGAYSERIEELAGRLGGKPGLVLGYVMAHELGHLLLGAASHAHSGIMSYPFEGQELILAKQGRLRFSPSQVKRLHRRLEERLPVPNHEQIARSADARSNP